MEENNTNNHINIHLPPDSGSDIFRSAYVNKIFPALEEFAPKLLLISAGFDAHHEDPLANIHLTNDDFFWITTEICHIAEKYAQSRVISCLEGGYNLKALKDAVSAHITALCA